MNRCGCPEEDSQQTSNSPGIVQLEESIVFAMIFPRTADILGVACLPNGDLKNRQLSVCRGDFSSYAELLERVVQPQLLRDPSRHYVGYHWATCAEIRAIYAQLSPKQLQRQSNATSEVGAFCVIDDAVNGYDAHARVGYSSPPIAKFWEKHERAAARGNLLIVLQARGTFKPTEADAAPLTGFANITSPSACSARPNQTKR
jgi:hypothetical protein